MKKQIIIIHGGTTFDSYKDYLKNLKNKNPNIEDFKKSFSWKDSLDKNLGENFEILKPRMPNSNNSKYKEWKIWFEKIIPFFKKDVILIGHSLGGIFLAKYLSENNLPKKIKALFLISPPFNEESESLASFKLTKSLKKLEEQCENIILYHSKDDPVVPFSHSQKYKKELPNIELEVFEDRQHFNQEKFPEIIEGIKSLNSY